ncbi:MAG: TIGR00725 family protein, partial [Chitinispirillaceae bacterium]|nr:TIGR00725 family protein [Chitinispirillaceae bacterium]
MSIRKPVIGVIGAGKASQEQCDLAYEIGKLIALRGAVLVCGGLGGVMEAAARGASENDGLVIGVLPGNQKTDANPYIDIVIPTGMGNARNLLVVKTADVIIALPGLYGTLSEIALALNDNKTVIYLPGTWDLKKAGMVDSAQFKEAFTSTQAIGLALDALRNQ